ncbi:MAG: diadenylate cyclase [Chthoniobacter sp.]|nr:diadenylate cyclase [Chthoniobacter sp.]
MIDELIDFAEENWRSGVEILILWFVIYHCYLYFRGTRGAKVLTGFALIFLTFIFVSQLLNLVVISWIIRSLTTFLALALVVIFQPELRRALAALGSHRIFSTAGQNRETVEVITETIFELSNRQFGALIALECDINIGSFAESGVPVDCELSPELVITIFQPKTPLHDGGLIVRNDRIVAAACIFPVSQREDLDRNLGLRHRAALGLTEESDAVAAIVSEETGIVSLCYRGKIERNFEPESFRRRLSELLLHEKYEKPHHDKLGGETDLAGPGERPLVSHQKERRNDGFAL